MVRNTVHNAFLNIYDTGNAVPLEMILAENRRWVRFVAFFIEFEVCIVFFTVYCV